jgi:hypothetical protein
MAEQALSLRCGALDAAIPAVWLVAMLSEKDADSKVEYPSFVMVHLFLISDILFTREASMNLAGCLFACLFPVR